MHPPGAAEALEGFEYGVRFVRALGLQVVCGSDALDTCTHDQYVEMFCLLSVSFCHGGMSFRVRD